MTENQNAGKSSQDHTSRVWSSGSQMSMIIPVGIVTVLMPGYPAKRKGEFMRKHILRSTMMFAAGAIVMGASAYFWPQPEIKAGMANGNDKFTMVSVPLSEVGEAEGIFVLNHLTGVITGGVLLNTTGKFKYRFQHNVAADFQTSAETPEPKYAIVSGILNLPVQGGVQPSYGVIYVGELSSGAVIAYAFERPNTRNVGTVKPLVKLDFFKFSESVGQ